MCRILKNIDYQFGDIDPEQAEVIKKFWKNFEPEKQSPEKTGFISVWSILNELYQRLQEYSQIAGTGL